MQRETKRRKGKRCENRSPDGSDYHDLSALAAYIDRVGAEKRNFRRFVIKLEGRDHYHYDAVIIRITKDNKIECSDKEHAPTAKEKKAIETELARATFPKSIAANDTYGLRKLIRETKGRDAALLFESRNAIGEIF